MSQSVKFKSDKWRNCKVYSAPRRMSSGHLISPKKFFIISLSISWMVGRRHSSRRTGSCRSNGGSRTPRFFLSPFLSLYPLSSHLSTSLWCISECVFPLEKLCVLYIFDYVRTDIHGACVAWWTVNPAYLWFYVCLHLETGSLIQLKILTLNLFIYDFFLWRAWIS